MKKALVLGVTLLIILTFAGVNMGAGWGPHQSTLTVGPGKNYATINEALAVAASGDTIYVFSGTYDETINIENLNGLTIRGFGKNVILKPSTTLPWNVGTYGTSRQAAVRVVNSTNINFEYLTMDFDLVKGNSVFGVFFWDSTGSLTGNTLKNMSVPESISPVYYEIGSCFRAPGYSDAARADIKISRNTFINCGRVSLLIHDYINATITGNTFYKDVADFGYAVELGSQSTANISFNTIYGFNTPAASDGSTSAGLYVENCFTGSTPSMTKQVSITGNNIYDCQLGLTVGNEWPGYAGDVDILLTLLNNNIHDNTLGGIVIADEGKSAGSSVTVKGYSNTIVNNGGFGYDIYTYGNGDINITLKGETISGHDNGMIIEYSDYWGVPNSSTYSVQISQSDINDNDTYGINNTVAGFTVNAVNNWWGDRSGPVNAVLNPEGQGNAASDYVTFDPWLKRANKQGFFNRTNHRNHSNWSWHRRGHNPQH